MNFPSKLEIFPYKSPISLEFPKFTLFFHTKLTKDVQISPFFLTFFLSQEMRPFKMSSAISAILRPIIRRNSTEITWTVRRTTHKSDINAYPVYTIYCDCISKGKSYKVYMHKRVLASLLSHKSSG